MELPSFLKKTIYVAYAIGSDEKGKMVYDVPHKINAQIEDLQNPFMIEKIGFVPDFDKMLLVPYGDESQFIDKQSILWVDVEPNEDLSNMDYEIKEIGNVINNNFILYCKSKTLNQKPIYYENNGKIIQAKVDIQDLVVYIELNKYLPINENTKVWLTKPKNIDDTSNLIRLLTKEKLNKNYKLTFERVTNG